MGGQEVMTSVGFGKKCLLTHTRLTTLSVDVRPFTQVRMPPVPPAVSVLSSSASPSPSRQPGEQAPGMPGESVGHCRPPWAARA